MSIILSKNNEPFDHIKELLSKSENEIIIISPYIKLGSLAKLNLPGGNIKITIITSLRLGDLLSGVSDVELYPYTKAKNYKLFINNHIHLKVYMVDWKNLIFGSSNLTSNGMGTNDNYNYELNSLVNSLDHDAIYYLRKILSESSLMHDDLYEYMKSLFDENQKYEVVVEPDITDYLSSAREEFLISSLPMTNDIKKLFDYLNGHFESDDFEFVNCAIHDQLLYNLPSNVTFDEFYKILKIEFFKSNFIQSLLSFIDEKDRYFGEVKAWIQKECVDVPVPSRRDLTGNIQVLYAWIESLSDGIYKIDRPNHSERIRRITA